MATYRRLQSLLDKPVKGQEDSLLRTSEGRRDVRYDQSAEANQRGDEEETEAERAYHHSF